jgi:hypothetical protein
VSALTACYNSCSNRCVTTPCVTHTNTPAEGIAPYAPDTHASASPMGNQPVDGGLANPRRWSCAARACPWKRHVHRRPPRPARLGLHPPPPGRLSCGPVQPLPLYLLVPPLSRWRFRDPHGSAGGGHPRMVLLRRPLHSPTPAPHYSSPSDSWLGHAVSVSVFVSLLVHTFRVQSPGHDLMTIRSCQQPAASSQPREP